MKRDQAAKIAEWTYPIDEHSTSESDAWAVAMRGPLARRIRRAINAAVRKERERCVGLVATELQIARGQGRWTNIDGIIEAIGKGTA